MFLLNGPRYVFHSAVRRRRPTSPLHVGLGPRGHLGMQEREKGERNGERMANFADEGLLTVRKEIDSAGGHRNRSKEGEELGQGSMLAHCTLVVLRRLYRLNTVC